MVHARLEGEMFSMALAEASIRNIPIITSEVRKTPRQPVVIEKKAFMHYDRESLKAHLLKFADEGVPPGDYNAYRSFSPENVMARFNKVFIEGPMYRRGNGTRVKYECLPKVQLVKYEPKQEFQALESPGRNGRLSSGLHDQQSPGNHRQRKGRKSNAQI